MRHFYLYDMIWNIICPRCNFDTMTIYSPVTCGVITVGQKRTVKIMAGYGDFFCIVYGQSRNGKRTSSNSPRRYTFTWVRRNRWKTFVMNIISYHQWNIWFRRSSVKERFIILLLNMKSYWDMGWLLLPC